MAATSVPAVDVSTAPPVRRRPPADPRWSEVRGPFWHLVRGAVVLGWLLLGAAVLVTGERESSVGSLLSAASAGRVSEVQVTGTGFEPGTRGYSVEQVRWSDGPVHHVAEIVEAHPRRAGERARYDGNQRRVVTTDAAAYLRAHLEGVRVTRTSESHLASGVGRWHVPEWVLSWVLVAWAATLFLLMAGPRPWRATRWAWFWLVVGAAPIGIPAFLVLSAPLPRLPAPRSGARVLTGGWAFLLTFLLLEPLLGN